MIVTFEAWLILASCVLSSVASLLVLPRSEIAASKTINPIVQRLESGPDHAIMHTRTQIILSLFLDSSALSFGLFRLSLFPIRSYLLSAFITDELFPSSGLTVPSGSVVYPDTEFMAVFALLVLLASEKVG